MLIGEYEQTVDSKFRVNIPSKFRTELGQTFVVAKGIKCIAIYPKEEWMKFLDGLKDMKKLRFFSAGSSECELDTQGRIVIPPKLREYIELEKEITVIGTFKHAEIWNRSRWAEYVDDSAYTSENIEEIMMEDEFI